MFGWKVYYSDLSSFKYQHSPMFILFRQSSQNVVFIVLESLSLIIRMFCPKLSFLPFYFTFLQKVLISYLLTRKNSEISLLTKLVLWHPMIARATFIALRAETSSKISPCKVLHISKSSFLAVLLDYLGMRFLNI